MNTYHSSGTSRTPKSKAPHRKGATCSGARILQILQEQTISIISFTQHSRTLREKKNPLVVTPRRMHKLSYLSWYSPTPSQENTSSFFMIRTHSLHPLSAGFQNSTFALHAAVWLQNNAFCDRLACWVIVIKWLPTKPKIYINFRQIERSSWALLIWRKSNFNQIC